MESWLPLRMVVFSAAEIRPGALHMLSGKWSIGKRSSTRQQYFGGPNVRRGVRQPMRTALPPKEHAEILDADYVYGSWGFLKAILMCSKLQAPRGREYCQYVIPSPPRRSVFGLADVSDAYGVNRQVGYSDNQTSIWTSA